MHCFENSWESNVFFLQRSAFSLSLVSYVQVFICLLRMLCFWCLWTFTLNLSYRFCFAWDLLFYLRELFDEVWIALLHSIHVRIAQISCALNFVFLSNSFQSLTHLVFDTRFLIRHDTPPEQKCLFCWKIPSRYRYDFNSLALQEVNRFT